VSELLENAVKYASDDETSLRISIQKSDHEVDVCVTNAVDPHQLNVLRREFALAMAGDAEETYLRRMAEAAKSEGTSRLGLVRIRYETGARLLLDTEDKQVSLHAVFPLEVPA
jgi:hypothetical protein